MRKSYQVRPLAPLTCIHREAIICADMDFLSEEIGPDEYKAEIDRLVKYHSQSLRQDSQECARVDLFDWLKPGVSRAKDLPS